MRIQHTTTVLAPGATVTFEQWSNGQAQVSCSLREIHVGAAEWHPVTGWTSACMSQPDQFGPADFAPLALLFARLGEIVAKPVRG